MRLREPFNGYRLSSGHFQFHMAFLVASNIALQVLKKKDKDGNMDDVLAGNPEAADIFNQLNLAHILVPVFTGMSLVCNSKEMYVLEKLFDTVSIF